MTNMMKLSNRAAKALDILADGGRVTYKLERNSYTGREQFARRFVNASGQRVAGLGASTYYELEKAGFAFRTVHSTSVGTEYKLATGA
jgi:hypothetical protein